VFIKCITNAPPLPSPVSGRQMGLRRAKNPVYVFPDASSGCWTLRRPCRSCCRCGGGHRNGIACGSSGLWTPRKPCRKWCRAKDGRRNGSACVPPGCWAAKTFCRRWCKDMDARLCEISYELSGGWTRCIPDRIRHTCASFDSVGLCAWV
jgi:hypothetical protein